MKEPTSWVFCKTDESEYRLESITEEKDLRFQDQSNSLTSEYSDYDYINS